MLLNSCMQYPSKFGKLSSGHRTGKGQLSFQSQRKAMPKNVQTTIQLHLFHILARLFSKSFKLGFSCMWTEKFQMYKLGFEEAEEPETKLLSVTGSWMKQRHSGKTSTSLTMLKPLTVWIATNWEFLKEMRVPDPLNCLLTNLYSIKKHLELDMEQQTDSK